MKRTPNGAVLVVDDDASVRKALKRLLQAHGLRPTGFASAEEFLRFEIPDGPCCAILDVCMPGIDGLDLQRRLGATIPVVFITGHGDIPMTVRAMKAGAVDFLAKPFEDAALVAAVRAGLARHEQTRRQSTRLAELDRRACKLSPRERQVMDLVVQGLPNKKAAQQLGITEKTVKAHRAKVMRKMQADSLANLVRMAEALRGSAAPGRGP